MLTETTIEKIVMLVVVLAIALVLGGWLKSYLPEFVESSVKQERRITL